jgi:hypothetical protein
MEDAHWQCCLRDADLIVPAAVNPNAQPDFSAAYARHAAAGKASAAAAAGRTLVSGAMHADIWTALGFWTSACPRDILLVVVKAEEGAECETMGCRWSCACIKERRQACAQKGGRRRRAEGSSSRFQSGWRGRGHPR